MAPHVLLIFLCLYINVLPSWRAVVAATVNPVEQLSDLTTPCTTLKPKTARTKYPLPSDNRNRTELFATNATDLLIGDKFCIETEDLASLECPIQELIKLRFPDGEEERRKKRYFASLLANVTSLISESVWKKNGKPLHRDNGNHFDQGGHKLNLYRIGSSDAGIYSCHPNYTVIPFDISRYFEFRASASYKLNVEDKRSWKPDVKPQILSPMTDLSVPLGSDAVFTCEANETLQFQYIYWFSFRPDTNQSEQARQEKQSRFFSAFNETIVKGSHHPLDEYIITDYGYPQLTLTNVSQRDIGIYGCFVANGLGFDIDYGSLMLEENSHNDDTISLSSLLKSYLESRDGINNRKNYTANVNALGVTDPGSSRDMSFWIYLGGVTGLFTSMLMVCLIAIRCYTYENKKKLPHNNLAITTPTFGDLCKQSKIRQHLPTGDCPDIYNIGKGADGFISGLHQNGGHLMSQSICNILDKEKNPSISSSNSDEASSIGKSMSSHGDTSRAFYLHTSNTTSTTVPMYDLPPSTGTSRLFGTAIVHNPFYGFIAVESDTSGWAFPRRNLERLNKIGEGQFGEVWRYMAHQKDGSHREVAVKQLRKLIGHEERERLEFMAEIEIMKLVNDHPNVIKMMNYCVDGGGPILVIMEYAKNGKLQSYLRDCRASRKLSFNYITASESNHLANITSKELIKFSYHIAKGMEYVASKGIIHRDLASRNILVSEDKICKVADFGFARRVNDECPYERSTAKPIPVKWTAPEALRENKFTSKSDVYSLGILMWEIVTLGATPYEDMNSQDVVDKVTAGGRLDRPAHCKQEFYDIMAACWHHDPTQRPTFKELAFQLEKLLLSVNDYIELDQYPEHAYYNIYNETESLEQGKMR